VLAGGLLDSKDSVMSTDGTSQTSHISRLIWVTSRKVTRLVKKCEFDE